MLWVGLKMLFSMNSQIYANCRDQEVSRNLHLLTDVDRKEPVEILKLLMLSEAKSPMGTTFTMLQFHVLKISDTIAMSIQNGLFSEWSLPGVTDELSHIERFCAGVSASHLHSEAWKGRFGILQYAIKYLRQCVYMPYLEKCPDGDTVSHINLAATKCIECHFPSLEGLPYQEIIHKCWPCQYTDMDQLKRDLQKRKGIGRLLIPTFFSDSGTGATIYILRPPGRDFGL